MSTFKIICYPDPILDMRAREITPEEIAKGKAEGHPLRDLSERMLATMYLEGGVGLAAPQVGIGLRMFVADASDGRNVPLSILNPVLSEPQGLATGEEGCLSLPNVNGLVTRPERIVVTGVDVSGNAIRIEADALLARIFQHEVDHLDGRLFVQRVEPDGQSMMRKPMKALEDDFEFLRDRRKARSKRMG